MYVDGDVLSISVLACIIVNVKYLTWQRLKWIRHNLLGIVAPALWQLIFDRHPCSFLGVHIVLVNRVLKEFSYKFQRMLVPSEIDSFSLLMKNAVQIYLLLVLHLMMHLHQSSHILHLNPLHVILIYFMFLQVTLPK